MDYRETAKKRLCIDFDGTIMDEVPYPYMGKLKPSAKKALEKLKAAGFYISIYSCRNNSIIYDQEYRLGQMIRFLDEHNLPYDDIITDPKPLALYYIDDRAIEFSSWDEILKKVEGKNRG